MAISAFLAFVLSGCGWTVNERSAFTDGIGFDTGQSNVARDAAIDPSTYAGDVAFRIGDELPTANGPLPLVLYLGLTPETDTRLLINGIVDLRPAQAELQRLLSGIVEEKCERQIKLNFHGAKAETDGVRARGTVQVAFYACDGANTASETRGALRAVHTIDAEAVLTAQLRGQCVQFSLRELDLVPRGVMGAVVRFFGSSDHIRAAVLRKANAVLSNNSICPTLPREVTALSPRFYGGSVREIGEGGIGVQLSGSIDISAPALIDLLIAAKDRGLLGEQS